MNPQKEFFSSVETVMKGLLKQNYLVSRKTATVVFLAGRLGKPILVEGPAGVGKTALAAAVAGAIGTDLVRLQCYPGLDESKTLYEWNYQKQLLFVQMHGEEVDIFGPDFMLERPLLKAFRAEKPVVLLVDEIDKSEEELESFLLEALSDFQVTIPEFGTVKAKHIPYVVITSNRARELSDALKRRCLYLYIDYPGEEREKAIICLKVPGIEDAMARDIARFIQRLRKLKLKKAPSITESIDWARTLLLLNRKRIDEDLVRDTLNVLLKYEDDIRRAEDEIRGLEQVLSGGGEKMQPAVAAGAPGPATTAAKKPGVDLSRFDF